ncbi:MAG: hypothetical protein ACOC2Y_08680 [Spirochaetota bacterium]
MVSSTAALPAAVVYLLLLFAEALGGEPPFVAEYLQDGDPTARIVVASEDGDTYRIDGTPRAAEDAESFPVVRVEKSDLAGHYYFVHMPDGGIPTVVDLTPVLAQMTVTVREEPYSIALPESDDSGSGDAALAADSTLHVLTTGGATLLSVADSGIVLLITEE